MAWKQILKPNLDDDPKHPLYIYQGGGILTDWYRWCLAVVAGSYGAKGSSYSAKTAWQSNNTKHKDRNIPDGIYVPLWYEGGTYGHVVIGLRKGNNITIWSSPYTHIATFQKFSGELNWALNYVGQVYGVGGFSGWSETVLSSRVIENKTEEVKPTPAPEPTPEPEPEPSNDNNEDPKEDDMSQPDEPFEPAKETDQQLVGGIIEEASSWFDFPNWLKLVAYLVGDAFIIGALLVPDIVNAMQAPTMSIWAEYFSKVLLEAGTSILLVFKLIKKK